MATKPTQNLDIIPTKAMLQKKNAARQFSAVVYESKKVAPRPTTKFAKKEEPTKEDSESELDDIFSDEPRRKKKKTVEDSSAFNMKTARSEVTRVFILIISRQYY
jgi:hypothetical protein